jgi:hypothetical protein
LGVGVGARGSHKVADQGGVQVRSRLLDRIKRLEQRPELAKPAVFCYGWLKLLPVDYAGERHVAIVKRSPNFEWCEFEERPGPSPPISEDPCFTVYLTEDDMRL